MAAEPNYSRYHASFSLLGLSPIATWMVRESLLQCVMVCGINQGTHRSCREGASLHIGPATSNPISVKHQQHIS